MHTRGGGWRFDIAGIVRDHFVRECNFLAEEPGIRPRPHHRDANNDRRAPPDVRRIVAGEATDRGQDQRVQPIEEGQGKRQTVDEGPREQDIKEVTALAEPERG